MSDITKYNPSAQLPAEAVAARDGFIRESVSENTLRAYKAQSRLWAEWCERHGLAVFPPESADALWIAELPDRVATWIGQRAAEGASRATIAGAIAALKWSYAQRSIRLDTEHPTLVAARRGIMRSERTARKVKQAEPLRADLVRAVLLANNGPLANLHMRRDAAVIALLYSFGLRRSELVALDYQTHGDGLGILELDNRVARVTLLRSKTEQEATQVVELDRDDSPASFAAVEKWIKNGGITPGTPVMRGIDPAGTVSDRRLHDNRVSHAVKSAVVRHYLAEGTDQEAARQLADRFSGHSGRVGLVVSAVEAGASDTSIMGVTRHKSPAMVARYGAQARSRMAAPHKRKGVGV